VFVLPAIFILLLGITDYNRQANKELAADLQKQLECERKQHLEDYWGHDNNTRAAIIEELCSPKKYK